MKLLSGAGQHRPLAAGEIAMASLLFGGAIDYSRVRIYRRRYLPFGLQPRNCAMTPNGAMYFHKSCCLTDFSAGSVHARHWFMRGNGAGEGAGAERFNSLRRGPYQEARQRGVAC